MSVVRLIWSKSTLIILADGQRSIGRLMRRIRVAGHFPGDGQTRFHPNRTAKGKVTTPASTAHQDFRRVRPMRVTRVTRLAPAPRLANVAEQMRRWMGEHLDTKEVVTEKSQRECPTNRSGE